MVFIGILLVSGPVGTAGRLGAIVGGLGQDGPPVCDGWEMDLAGRKNNPAFAAVIFARSAGIKVACGGVGANQGGGAGRLSGPGQRLSRKRELKREEQHHTIALKDVITLIQQLAKRRQCGDGTGAVPRL
jgi:hypothetical protein